MKQKNEVTVLAYLISESHTASLGFLSYTFKSPDQSLQVSNVLSEPNTALSHVE